MTCATMPSACNMWMKPSAFWQAARSAPTARDVYAGRIAEQTGIDKKAVLVQLESAVRGPGAGRAAKKQNELSRQGIAADIRVPYDRGGEAALGAASAARQLVAAMLQDAGTIPTSGSG